MDFEIVGDITVLGTIASGHGIRDLKRLRRSYRKDRWRKVKGMARVRVEIEPPQTVRRSLLQTAKAA